MKVLTVFGLKIRRNKALSLTLRRTIPKTVVPSFTYAAFDCRQLTWIPQNEERPGFFGLYFGFKWYEGHLTLSSCALCPLHSNSEVLPTHLFRIYSVVRFLLKSFTNKPPPLPRNCGSIPLSTGHSKDNTSGEHHRITHIYVNYLIRNKLGPV